MKPGDILLSGEHALPPGEEKNDPAFVAAARRARRHLRQRRVLGGASRACLDRGPRPASCRPMPAAPCRPSSTRSTKALEAPERPLAAIVGGAKVSTKLELLGNLVAKVERPDHRRRHGQHLPRRARQAGRQVAVRARLAADRARDPGQGEGQRLRDRAAGRCRGGARSSRRNAPSRVVAVDQRRPPTR